MKEQKFLWTLRVIAGIALPLSLVLSVGLALDAGDHIVASMEKRVKSLENREILKDSIYVSSVVLALFLVILAASQTAPTAWKKMEEWGHRLDNWLSKKPELGKEYYLDVAYRLRKEANKLKQSAQDNYAEINGEFRKISRNFVLSPTGVGTDEEFRQKIDEVFNQCHTWLYKLDLANGDVKGDECTSYYSASEKLVIAFEKLNIARDLLAFHKAPVLNFRTRHDKLANKIAEDKDHIIGLQSRIMTLKKDIIKAYKQLNLLLFDAESRNLFVLTTRTIEHSAIKALTLDSEKESLGHKKRMEKDKLLPINSDTNVINQCINNIRDENNQNVSCCPFLTHHENGLLIANKGKSPSTTSTLAESSSSSSSSRRIDESSPLLTSL